MARRLDVLVTVTVLDDDGNVIHEDAMSQDAYPATVDLKITQLAAWMSNHAKRSLG